jgi:hypothetical protein
MSQPSIPRKIVSSIGPVAAALFVLAVLAEGATRFLNRGQTIYDIEMYRYSRLLKEDAPPEAPAMHHWHRKNATAVLQGVEIRTNDLRMRDRVRSSKPAPGVHRVLVIGDSITLGWGVPQEKSYSADLDRRLGELAPGKFEVLNAGVGNYTLSRMIGLYDHALRELDPEIVVLAFYLTNASREQESSLSRFFDTPLQFPVFLWSRGLRVYARVSKAASFRDHYLDLYREGRPEYEEFRSQLKAFLEKLKSEGRHVLLVNVPDVRYASQKPYPFARISERVLSIGRDSSVATVDLLPGVSDLSPETAVNSVEDRHPSPAAHTRFAEVILKALQSAGFAPAEATPGSIK